MLNRKGFLVMSIMLLITTGIVRGQDAALLKPLTFTDGRISYETDNQGNRIPDFSYAGYKGGDELIPDVPIRVVVPVTKEDATLRIQAALNYVASLPADKNGVRGAVLLEKGNYEVSGTLTIAASGVVLRGSGMDEKGTILTGSGVTRETLIRMIGKNDRITESPIPITNAYVPVNAMKLNVTPGYSLKPGDNVLVHRPSTKAWIEKLGMTEFGGETAWLGWKPGTRDIFWDRKIVAINGDELVLNAPITTSLDKTYGGGAVIKYQWNGRINQVGVENLQLRSSFDKNNVHDEDHRWMGITIENASDTWVRQVTFKHFAGSAVAIFETSNRITVEDCISLNPVSEIGGQRRYTFYNTGQQVLFQRLYAEYGYHDFAIGFAAAGPNAFVQCESYKPYSFSGTIDSWASGALFDIVNIDGNALRFSNRGQDGQGAGWTAANSVLWQCTAARIECYQPPTANNWAFGSWAQFAGDGLWTESNSHIEPRSLYYAQLAERKGSTNISRSYLLPLETEASSSPSVEQAKALSALSEMPSLTMEQWIYQASQRQPILTTTKNSKTIDQVGYTQTASRKQGEIIAIKNGILVRGNSILTGKRNDVPWWRGNTRPFALKDTKLHITRFVPGRIGKGLTDDLNEVTNVMVSDRIVALEHNYGLWYDRRRDDHERVRRMDGEVWAPFYELPFARSGKDTAWDGLSKYDLAKYNPWYWSRLKQFADLADVKGLLLIHQNYFQHNILEAGAHWADFPWRTANNINDTGFPEPPPYAGDKRIFMADQFYDISHPVRRQLHRAYIRQCLENFKTNNSVVQLIGAEYTGPLHFVQFWIDTIAEWEKETGKNAVIGLSATKDVQDAILTDAARAAIVDLIDIRYWHNRHDGSIYAPNGGQNLAPRQHARLVKPGKSSFDQVYKMVRQYRDQYPDKAVLYTSEGEAEYGWAVFMAGGSLANIPVIGEPAFLTQAASMKPIDLPGNSQDQYALGDSKEGYIVYSRSANTIKLDLTNASGAFDIYWIDPKDGKVSKNDKSIKGGQVVELVSPRQSPMVLWANLQRKNHG